MIHNPAKTRNHPKNQAPAPAGPLAQWRALVASGSLSEDAAQETAAARLDALWQGLGYGVSGMESGSRKSAHKKNRLFFRSLMPQTPNSKPDTLPRGVYLWGEVGRGKSMLMDLFYSNAPVEARRRVHFHAFMQETHAAIHRIRAAKSGDPVALRVKEVAEETRLLCFDELQATDVADATLLTRLFEGLFDAGVVIVSTSNRPPAEIYQGGVQRERFARLSALLAERMEVVALSGPTDYRTQKSAAPHTRWFSPLGPEATLFLHRTLDEIAPHTAPESLILTVQGRELRLNSYPGGVVAASFAQLCERALGPADYLALAEHARLLVLSGIPLLSPEKRNEAKRFVTLIDALYEAKTRLIATASAPPEALYPEGDGSFEFKRTVSRLAEMMGDGWGK